jgi:co-chaperonin GroES (HSP10)
MEIMKRFGPVSDRVLYQAEAEEARAHPGVWFTLQTKDSEAKAWAAAQQIKDGRRAAFRPARSFDAVTRGREVLIRYIGDTTTEDLA